jgi:GR25 family glycosyltransferase involved in LPS biosynthesis
MIPLNKLFDKIYVISMPRSVDRRAHIVEHFGKNGISNWEFYDAIDGKGIDKNDPVFQKLLQLDNPWNASIEALACSLSHVTLYEKVLREGLYQKILICEDDVVFVEGASETIEGAARCGVPDWDILHLHSHFPISDPTEARNRYRTRVGEYVFVGFNEGGGTLCYGMNIRCMKFLLSIAYPIDKAADGLTNCASLIEYSAVQKTWGFKGGMRPFLLAPFICEHNHFTSTIGYNTP